MNTRIKFMGKAEGPKSIGEVIWTIHKDPLAPKKEVNYVIHTLHELAPQKTGRGGKGGGKRIEGAYRHTREILIGMEPHGELAKWRDVYRAGKLVVKKYADGVLVTHSPVSMSLPGAPMVGEDDIQRIHKYIIADVKAQAPGRRKAMPVDFEVTAGDSALLINEIRKGMRWPVPGTGAPKRYKAH